MARTPVRPSTETDVPEIASIYGHHVLYGTASFEVVPPPPEEIARRRLAVLDCGLPFLVAEVGGAIAGYAYASSYRPRLAYRYTVEDSIYILPDQTRRGVGRALLSALIERCERGETGEGSEGREWRQMIAVIGDSANVASIRLHAAFGFRHVGTLRSVGFKFGRWLDTVFMQRPLGKGDETLPVIPDPALASAPPTAE